MPSDSRKHREHANLEMVAGEQGGGERELVWYHDFSWSSPGQSGGPIAATVRLSNDQRVGLQIKSAEQLRDLIGSLERAI